MISFDLKEGIKKIIIKTSLLKYERGRQFYVTFMFLIAALIVCSSTIIFKQRMDLRIKENIIRSYYGEDITLEFSDISEDTKNKQGENYAAREEHAGENFGRELPEIKVYICGKIKKPGVYSISEGSRVIDVLDLAGGPEDGSVLSVLNLAQKVTDGQKIYIPSEDEVNIGWEFTGKSIGTSYTASQTSGSGLININAAGQGELETLPGIGPVTAEKILNYRDQYGLFETIEEIKNVQGIGDKKYQAIKDFICIN